MTVAQESLQLIPESLEAIPQDFDGLKGQKTRRGRFTGLIRGSRRYLPGLTFLVGLLVGWMVIGWLLWPVQWSNSEPWQLLPKHQRTFVRLVAEDYWLTGDISRARDALAGWDEEALAELMAAMENQASSPEERQHLIALAEALKIPDASESLLASLLSQKVILFSFAFSALPLVAAVVLAAYSLLRSRPQHVEELLTEEELLEEELEELLGQQEEKERTGQQEERRQEQEKQGAEEEEEKSEEDEEEDEDTSPWVQDLVADLFDEDDTEITRLENLCKKLPDIEASNLMELAKKIVHDLHRSNSPRHG